MAVEEIWIRDKKVIILKELLQLGLRGVFVGISPTQNL